MVSIISTWAEITNDFLDVLLNYVEGMHKTSSAVSKLLPFATEASWATGRWDTLQSYLSLVPEENDGDFNISIGRTLLALRKKDRNTFEKTVQTLREQIASSLTTSTTSSLSVCHDTMLKFHVLTELEMIAGIEGSEDVPRKPVLESLDRRLEAIGSYLNDKQYLLGIRRAAMQLSR
jgi:serine/threonine-protein kinase ATR